MSQTPPRSATTDNVEDEEINLMDYLEERRGSLRVRDGGGGAAAAANPESDVDDDGDMPDLVTDTSAEQARTGRDVQGIPWETLNVTREKYRDMRIQQYKNYENLDLSHEHIQQECQSFAKDGKYFDFEYNTRSVKSTIVHFQLRNLVWATSKHDVYVMYHHAVNHWTAVARRATEVLNLSGTVVPFPEIERRPWLYQRGLGRVQISTMCAKGNLLVVGGFHGEMVCKFIDRPGVAYSAKITHDENAITNAIDIFESVTGGMRVMSSNNDCIVRTFDCEAFSTILCHSFPWAVNHTSMSPDRKLVLVVGDDPEAILADSQSGNVVATLKGHLDFSFASAWHPDGRVFATGNQDTTCRLWDIRHLSSPLLSLKGRIGAIRSIRFSSDGRFMAIAEPADFVHVFDTKQNFGDSQEIDLFGELAGISFSPDSESLFIGVADRTYGSLLEYSRRRINSYRDMLL